MEDGDSDSDKSPHRNCNYAGNYQLPRIDDPLPTSPRGGELTLPLGEMEGVTNEVEGDGALGFVVICVTHSRLSGRCASLWQQ